MRRRGSHGNSRQEPIWLTIFRRYALTRRSGRWGSGFTWMGREQRVAEIGFDSTVNAEAIPHRNQI